MVTEELELTISCLAVVLVCIILPTEIAVPVWGGINRGVTNCQRGALALLAGGIAKSAST